MATYKVKGISDARIGWNNASVLTYQDVPFGSELAIEGDVADVNFEGDGQVEKAYYDASISGTISADKFTQEVLQRVFNKTPVVAGLPGGVASRQYVGSQDELAASYVEIGITLDAIDEATGGAKSLRLTVFKVKPSPYVQGNVGHRTKMGMQIGWSAVRTSTDIVGGALPSVPTGGAIYAIDVLT
jgi:hypothetical protein